MFWNLVKHIKRIHPDRPIPIKLVWRRPGWAPASYLTDTKDRTKKPTKEWYEVAIFARRGNDEAVGNHEARHYYQRHNPELSLFTKGKLIEILQKTKSEETKERIERVLQYLEKLYDKIHGDPLEEDAIIVERLIVESPDPTSVAARWLKQEANKVL